MDPSIRWLTCALTEVPKDDAWLSPTERERQTRLTVDKRRNDWRLGRFTAKRALERAGLNAPLQMISILPAKDGAPEIILDGAPLTVCISLSHREGIGACALCEAPGLGCDLEVVEPRSSRFVQDYFTAAERAQLSRSATPQRDTALIWSAKESALKALRVGLSRDTRCISVTLTEQATPTGWAPLSAQDAELGRRYFGWWRPGQTVQTAQMVLTVVATSPRPAPLWLGSP